VLRDIGTVLWFLQGLRGSLHPGPNDRLFLSWSVLPSGGHDLGRDSNRYTHYQAESLDELSMKFWVVAIAGADSQKHCALESVE